MSTASDLLGRNVVVTNPSLSSAEWRGRCIAIAFDPTVILEFDDGERMSLPLAWTRVDDLAQQREEVLDRLAAALNLEWSSG